MEKIKDYGERYDSFYKNLWQILDKKLKSKKSEYNGFVQFLKAKYSHIWKKINKHNPITHTSASGTESDNEKQFKRKKITRRKNNLEPILYDYDIQSQQLFGHQYKFPKPGNYKSKQN